MRLWLPQLYTIVTTHDLGDNNNSQQNLCSMIEYSVNQSAVNLQSPDWIANCSAPVCVYILWIDIRNFVTASHFSFILQIINDAMYMNTIYSGFSGLIGYVIAGFLIRCFGTRNVLGMLFKNT